jgi:branched-chain amino acid transport system ATP-binding protein
VTTTCGRSQALFGVSLHLDQGEAVTLMRRNRMGKTTTVRTIMGILRF